MWSLKQVWLYFKSQIIAITCHAIILYQYRTVGYRAFALRLVANYLTGPAARQERPIQLFYRDNISSERYIILLHESFLKMKNRKLCTCSDRVKERDTYFVCYFSVTYIYTEHAFRRFWFYRLLFLGSCIT